MQFTIRHEHRIDPSLLMEIRFMSAELTAKIAALTAQVDANATVIASAVTAIDALRAAVAGTPAADDPAVLAALDTATATLTSNNAQLSAAVNPA